MFPHPDLFMMFTQQLLADRIAILCHDPDQSINIFCMVAYQFRKFLHLRLQLLQAPDEGPLRIRGRLLLGQWGSFTRQR